MIFKQKISVVLLKQFNLVFCSKIANTFNNNSYILIKNNIVSLLNNLNRNFSKYEFTNNTIYDNKKTKLNKRKIKNQNINKESQKFKIYDDIVTKKSQSISSSFEQLEDEIVFRRDEAKRTILIKMKKQNDNKEAECLITDIELIGCKINNIFILKNQNSLTNTNISGYLHALIEFKTNDCIETILNRYSGNFAGDFTSCRNRSLFYLSPSANRNLNTSSQLIHNIQYLEPGSINSSITISHLKNINDCNEQIKELYNYNKLNELSYRTRFFIASLIEDSLRSFFNDCFCLPFGSSLNKAGNLSSDLDLNLSLTNQLDFLKKNSNFSKRFFFINKKIESKIKNQHLFQKKTPPYFDLVEYLITFILPKFETTKVISNCRVPIIRFDFLTDSRINCDLSLSHTKIAYQMTKLFWVYSKIDERIPPLMFLIRYWANLWGLQTKKRPSPNFTNFQLGILLFNFLSRLENPVIPSLEEIIEINSLQSILKNVSLNNDASANDYVVKNIPIYDFKNILKTKNNSSLNELFQKFLDYYLNRDFIKYKISLKRELIKNKENCFFMENPLEPQTNAAKNVSIKEIEKLKNCCKHTIFIIDSIKNKETKNFDLLKLFSAIENKKLVI